MTYAVQATIEDFLMKFHKFDEQRRGEIYDALFEQIYLFNSQLSDIMHLPVNNWAEGSNLVDVFLKEEKPESPLQPSWVAIDEPKKSEKIINFPSATVVVDVPSSSDPGKYYQVGLDPSSRRPISCTCLDFKVRRNPFCKHMKAVASGLY